MFQVSELKKTKVVFKAYVDEKLQDAESAAATKALAEKIAYQAKCKEASDPSSVAIMKAANEKTLKDCMDAAKNKTDS